jgi:hypothetical protein
MRSRRVAQLVRYDIPCNTQSQPGTHESRVNLVGVAVAHLFFCLVDFAHKCNCGLPYGERHRVGRSGFDSSFFVVEAEFFWHVL